MWVMPLVSVFRLDTACTRTGRLRVVAADHDNVRGAWDARI